MNSGTREPSPRNLVLVVDDEPEIRESVREFLEEEGMTVMAVADGRQAIDRAAKHHPAVVLLDMSLPLLSGEEVAGQLQIMFPAEDAPRIVVMTADGRAAEWAQRIGAVDYLHKPFDLDDLVSVVRKALVRE